MKNMIGVLCAVVIVGCRTTPISPSIKTHCRQNIPGMPCVLFSAPEGIDDVVYKNKRFFWTMTVKGGQFKGPGEFFFSSATPVAEDGYYLTARHCVEDIPKGVILWIARVNPHNSSPEWGPVRVIWKSPNADIAILHSNVRTSFHYEFSKSEKALKKGAIVIQLGIRSGCKFGRIADDVIVDKKNAAFSLVRYTANPIKGDSGGPLLNTNGELLGIVSMKEWPILDGIGLSFSVAVRPNSNIIMQLIDSDRKTRKTHCHSRKRE